MLLTILGRDLLPGYSSSISLAEVSILLSLISSGRFFIVGFIIDIICCCTSFCAFFYCVGYLVNEFVLQFDDFACRCVSDIKLIVSPCNNRPECIHDGIKPITMKKKNNRCDCEQNANESHKAVDEFQG